ncbi:hypothetical protein [Candidatus Vondammii sp. HM_W22]|uniref:hypothetical protein n=1 Tax=Candidatus Vondammii sp. HM_W22 TaxID=2687299 RepID=UPI001F1496FA|nr:hypothetical protein [Candidatus Vondammii sp. HM_W22]
MLVLEKGYETPVEVYGIYWIDGERIYWVIPYEGHEGFVTLSEKDSEVVDPEIKDVFILRKNDADEDLFLHWAADKDNLIYDLVDHDPEAMKEFKRRLSSLKNTSD